MSGPQLDMQQPCMNPLTQTACHTVSTQKVHPANPSTIQSCDSRSWVQCTMTHTTLTQLREAHAMYLQTTAEDSATNPTPVIPPAPTAVGSISSVNSP